MIIKCFLKGVQDKEEINNEKWEGVFPPDSWENTCGFVFSVLSNIFGEEVGRTQGEIIITKSHGFA